MTYLVLPVGVPCLETCLRRSEEISSPVTPSPEGAGLVLTYQELPSSVLFGHLTSHLSQRLFSPTPLGGAGRSLDASLSLLGDPFQDHSDPVPWAQMTPTDRGSGVFFLKRTFVTWTSAPDRAD